MTDPSMSAVDPTAIPASRTLLDVRETQEWVAGHAPEAVHLPMSELTGRLEEIPEGPLAVVCKVGGRSAQVTAFLAQRGHDAVNVTGGMLAWEAAGRPLTAEGQQPARIV